MLLNKFLLRNKMNIIITIFIITFINNVHGPKNRNKNYNKHKNYFEQNVQSKSKECPEKVKFPSDDGKLNGGDKDSFVLSTIFKNYLINVMVDGFVSSHFDRTFQTNSAIWFLKQNIDKMLNFEMDKNDEMAKESEEWAELLENYEPVEETAKTEKICKMFQFAIKLYQKLSNITEKNSKFEIFLVESRIDEILGQVEIVNCNSADQVEETFATLSEPPKILTINGQNFIKLLEMHEHLRHFFCHEIEINNAKVILQSIIGDVEMTMLEDQFPHIMRLDLMLTSTTIQRFNKLMENRSSSLLYKEHFVRLTVGLLIWETRRKVDALGVLASVPSSRIDAFVSRTQSLIADAYRNVSSDRTACVLYKLLELMLTNNQWLRMSEKAMQQGRRQCADQSERDVTVQKFVHSDQGVLYQLVVTAAFLEEKDLNETLETMKMPGAKTRLKNVMGRRKRFVDFLKECNLEFLYQNDVFADDARLWAHYSLGMEHDDPIERQSHKLGADIVVFMRWFKRQIDAQNCKKKFKLISEHMDDEVYDPLFDQEHLEEYEQFLRKLFTETKTFLLNLKLAEAEAAEKSDQKEAKNIFKRWKEVVEKARNERVNGSSKNEEICNWIRHLHNDEFSTLMQNGKLQNLLELIKLHGHSKIREDLQLFVDETVAVNMFNNLIIFELNEKRQSENGFELNRCVEAVSSNSEEEMVEKNCENVVQKRKFIKEINLNDKDNNNNVNVNDEDPTAEFDLYGHIVCPAKNVSIEEIRNVDSANNPNEPMIESLKNLLLQCLTENAENSIQMALRFELICAIWYLNLYAEQTLKILETMEPQETVFENEVKSLIAIYMKLFFHKSDDLYLKNNVLKTLLIRVFRFIGHIANNKILFENSDNWKVFRKERLGAWIGSVTTKQWTIPEYNWEEANDIFEKLCQDGTNLLMNITCVRSIIRRFMEIQHFLCSLSGQNEVQKVKGRLMVLTGENLLLTLEERYPEVLQIDEPVVCSDIARFKYLLQHKSGTDSAYLAAVRLTLPILMQKMKVMVEQIPRKAKNRKIIFVLKKAMGKVRLDAFYGLRSLKSQPQSFCIVQKFVKYSQKALELHESANGMVKMEAIANWKAEKCECEEEQRRVFQDQFQESFVKHFALLSIYFMDNAYKIVEFVQNTRGARTRVKKLMKASNLNSNFFLKQLRNSICFYKQESNFVDAIFGEDKATRVAGKLSVFIAVWVCWLDDELSEQNANRTVGLKKLDEIVWRQKREDIEDIYDEIVDDTLDELALRSQRLKDLFFRIFQFVQAKRGERRLNRLGIGHRKNPNSLKLLVEWNKFVEGSSAQQMDNHLQMIDEQTTEFDQWHRVMQFQALIELLNGEEFRTKIKNGIEQSENAKKRLLDFVDPNFAEALLNFLKSDAPSKFEEELKLIMGKVERENNENMDKEIAFADRKMSEMIGEEEKIKKQKEKNENRKKKSDQKQRESEQQTEEGKEGRERESELQTEEGKEGSERESELQTEEGKEGSERESERQTEEGKEGSERESELQTEEGKESREKVPILKLAKSPRKAIKLAADFSGILNKFVPTNSAASPKSESSEIMVKEGNESGAKCRQILREELATKTKLTDFILDSTLRSNYREFMANPSEAKRCKLDIGIYVNEIWHRMEIIDQLNNFIGINSMAHFVGVVIESAKVFDLRGEWRKMEKILANISAKINESEFGFDQIEGNLHKILKKIIFASEGTKFDDTKENYMDTNEQKSVKMQLHQNKLAKTIIRQQIFDKNAENNWQNLGENKQHNVLKMLNFNRNGKKLAYRFNAQLENWKNLIEQQQIDRRLYDQFYEHTKDIFGLESVHLGVKFAENTQQIYFQHPINNNNDNNLNAILISELLTENGFTESSSSTTEMALKELKEIVSKWSNNEATLLETGSYVLGTHAQRSDIDTICIVPQKLGHREEKERFYGIYLCNLDIEADQRLCEDNSLYCQFCKNPKIELLHKIPSTFVPMIELKIANIDFDISFAAIPDVDWLPKEPLGADEVELMMKFLAKQESPQEAMLKALSGYLANKAIKKMVGTRNFSKFKNLLWATKFWAKSNHIYGNQLGFFNGISLAILCAKILFYYPNAAVPFMLEKFMLIFSTWNWPMPVKIAENGPNDFEPFNWRPSAVGIEKEQMQMPIITPTELTQNATKYINKSTMKIIQNEMKQTLSQMIILKNGPILSSDKNEWKKLFPAKQFIEKYRHFIVITCIVSVKQHILQFCGFVERKLRVQLLHFDQIMDSLVDYSHIKSDQQFGGNDQCPTKIRENNPRFRNPLCKKWLVGVKMKNAQKSSKNIKLEEYFDEILNKEIDTKIFEQYDAKVLKGWYQHIKLESKYVKWDELDGWNIQTKAIIQKL